MSNFGGLPIQKKLLVSFMLTIGIALSVAGVGIVASTGLTVYTGLQRDLDTFVRVMADNSSASLAFNDPQSAGDNLSALRARTEVVSACVYRLDGTVLATYFGSQPAAGCPGPSRNDETRSTLREMTVSRSVYVRERRVGTLVLRYDLGEVYEAMARSALTVLIVSLLASALAFRFAARLRRSIVAPIVQLASTARSISETRDYGIRAEELTRDEVGQLAAIFNEMVANVQLRDLELKRALSDQEATLVRLERLNQDLQRSNRDLARSNDDLERFAYIASHDLQEPLRTVSLSCELLLSAWPAELSEDSLAHANRITGSLKRMRELLVSLLTYAELAGAAELPLKTVDLNVLLERVQENLLLSIEESQAVITSDPLPTVAVYESHVQMLFQNLIGNAIKYRGAAAPRIHVSCRENDGLCQIGVADNGDGIDPRYHATIFTPFKRLHGQEVPGTGVGLAICLRVVERHGGRIWVESKPGEGATFYFTLPLG
jgi:signal transduction histidine kinase